MPPPRSRLRRKQVVIGVVVVGLVLGLVAGAPWGAAEFCRRRGLSALRSRQDETAREWFQRAETYHRGSGTTQFLLARASRRLNRFEDMQRHLDRAVALGISQDQAERERWLSLAQIGQIDRLGARLQSLLEQSSADDSPEVFAALASGFALSYDMTSAGYIVGEWMSRYPQDPESFLRAAQLKQSQADWPAAAEMFRRSLDLAPQQPQARLSLARCLSKANDPAGAEREFRRVLQDQPGSQEARTGLAACLINLNQTGEARDLLREVLRRSPGQFDAARMLGELELSLGESQAALDVLMPLAQAWPRDKQLCTLLARAWQEAGQAEQARPYWDKAEQAARELEQVDRLQERIQQDGRDVDSRYQLGVLVIERRSREEGVGWLQSVLFFAPEHRGAHTALADYYDRIGERELAELHRERGTGAAQ